MDAPLKEFLCISLHNILDIDNLVDVYHNSFDTSLCLLVKFVTVVYAQKPWPIALKINIILSIKNRFGNQLIMCYRPDSVLSLYTVKLHIPTGIL